MTSGPAEWLSRYFDDTIDEYEMHRLQDWLKESLLNASQFANAAMLHDRIFGEQTALLLEQDFATERSDLPRSSLPPLVLSRYLSFRLSFGLIAVLILMAVMWLGVAKTTVSASSELQRLIAVQAKIVDRTYRVAVEESTDGRRRDMSAAEDRRPPKPSLDDAILHVRSGQQFVLVRQLPDGGKFVTGCNSSTSWAVRPEGPVRVSSDRRRFSHDLPGHENDVPLFQIEHGLGQLQKVYDVQLLPVETYRDRLGVAEKVSDPDGRNGPSGASHHRGQTPFPETQDLASHRIADDITVPSNPTRLLVAVKRQGYRGPRRVEITYDVVTGHIIQIRFLEMPYGPKFLTVRLTLLEERELGADFFDHAAHHAAERRVELE